MGALLQKLESAKAIYVSNLNEAHEAVVASLRGIEEDQNTVDEAGTYFPRRINANTKREDILQTERDPLDCKTFYTDDDFREFLGDLDDQLQYKHLAPESTSKGLTYICNGRIMEPIPLRESISKLLQPLPSYKLHADDDRLHQTRINDPGYAYKSQVSSFNAVWFTFLDGDHSGSWNLYHDAVSEEHPQNFWEMIRASIGSRSLH